MANIWKRTDRDTWTVDYRDSSRVRRRLTAKSREEAEELLAEKIKESRQAAPPPTVDPNITLDAYADVWLERIKTELAPKTVDSYGQMLRLHIRPALGRMKVRAIHRTHIRDLLQKKRATGFGKGEPRSYSKNTLRLIKATLSAMLGDAVDDGIIMTNPALGVARRGRRRSESLSQAERQEKIRPMTLNQLGAFLATADAQARAARAQADSVSEAQGRDAVAEREAWRARRDAVLFLTLADAGLRPGEVLTLRWEDVDLAARTLHVGRALSGKTVKSTKTGTSRVVDLTPRLAAALSAWQASQEATALTEGGSVSPWVFPSSVGTPLDEAAVARLYHSLLVRAGLPRFRLYDLRHTYATHLLAAGAPITYVSAQLGHSNPATTLRHHARWLPTGNQVWADRLAQQREEATSFWHQTSAPRPCSSRQSPRGCLGRS